MSTETATVVEDSGSGILRGIFLILLFLVSLTIFTLVKIPQSKIQAWILGTLNQQINPMGIAASADEGKLVLGFGLTYEMSGVRLTMIQSHKVLKFSRLEISPRIIVPLLQGKIGGHFALEEGTGVIAGDFMMSSDEIDAAIQIENLNLGRMGILPFAAGIEGTADLKGTIDLTGSLAQPSSLNGRINLTLAKAVIDSQKFMGFDIPRTAMNDGVIDVAIGAGKATITAFRLGKPGGTDDLNGALTGEIKLGRTIESSDANLLLRFGFSDRYRAEKTISMLDSLLGMFKQPDGSFSMRLTGPLAGMQSAPGT